MSTGTEVLDRSLKARVGDDAGDAASFGQRLALDLLDVGGEVDRPGAADVAADAEAVRRSPSAAPCRTALSETSTTQSDLLDEYGLAEGVDGSRFIFRLFPSRGQTRLSLGG